MSSKNYYTSYFFNKNPTELTFSDIQLYFKERQEESSTLEFKCGDVEITDVYKEVAAFLNTEGGLLIIGAPRESKEVIGRKTITYCQGDVTYSKFISKDWLHQKLYSNITPSPTQIYIKEITTQSGNIFILDIPQSFNPPHQSNADGRYYIRIENEAKPAPHGLIQALFDKRKKPKIKAEIKRVYFDNITDYLNVSLHNESSIPADKVSFIVELFNISETDNNFIESDDEVLGKKFSLSKKLDQVLASVISFGVDFKVRHTSKKYLVSVSFWSRESDFDCVYFIIDPISNSILSKYWLDENENLVDAIKQLKDK